MDLHPKFKLSALSLLIVLPAFTWCENIYATPCSFCGMTIGFGAGFNTMMSNNQSASSVSNNVTSTSFSMTALPTSLINQISTTSDPNVYKYAAMARLFAGYAIVFENHTYLGFEGGFNFLGANSTQLPQDVVSVSYDVVLDGPPTTANNTNKSLSTDTSVSRDTTEPFIDIKLGLVSTPTALLYLRGGFNYNKVTIKQSTTFTASGTTSGESVFTETSFVDTIKKSKSAIGYRAGLGVEFMITPLLGIGVDYIYSFYPRVSTSTSRAVTDLYCEGSEGCSLVPGTQNSSAKASVNDQQVLAQLIYHFDM